MTNEENNAEKIAALTLEHLRYIRASIDRIENDVRDVKFRISQIEESSLHHTRRFDRVDEQLLTIERRLGLVEA
jgi:septation ring formation regulator EzrA